MDHFPIPPGSWLGLLGGGQLGRMFAQAAATLGYRVYVLEKDPHAPASAVSPMHLQAAYTDDTALTQLAEKCAAVTTEFENVPASSLEFLAQSTFVSPSAKAVSITQDRMDEKSFLSSVGAPVAPHCLISDLADAENVDEALFPGILKTARLGYDGKGQIRVKNKQELIEGFKTLGRVKCVLEKMLPLHREISVISARNIFGDSCTFPVSENEHRNGILAVSIMPARIPEEIAVNARRLAKHIVDSLEYVGVLCVEFFVLKDGTLVVNEMAPRPHNSGHATIEGCVCSQYDQQVRAMTNMALGDTTQIQYTVMLNILGDLWFKPCGSKIEPDWDKVLAIPDAKLHLYGKLDARRGRKMGHVTCVGKTAQAAMDCALKVCETLGIDKPANL